MGEQQCIRKIISCVVGYTIPESVVDELTIGSSSVKVTDERRSFRSSAVALIPAISSNDTSSTVSEASFKAEVR